MNALRLVRSTRRCFSSVQSASAVPWFVDAEDVIIPQAQPAQASSSQAPPIPANTPNHLKTLYAELLHSPHLERSSLAVMESASIPLAPPLPKRLPQGRRRRGGSDSGEDVFDSSSGIWNWILMAQVKEGTEDRGAIESVVRVVRKSLLSWNPPIPLPPNSKRRIHNGWAMVDGGNFAVHIVSKDAKSKYFNTLSQPAEQVSSEQST